MTAFDVEEAPSAVEAIIRVVGMFGYWGYEVFKCYEGLKRGIGC